MTLVGKPSTGKMPGQLPTKKSSRAAFAASGGSLLITIIAGIYFLVPIWILIAQGTKSLSQMNSTSAMVPSGSFFDNLDALFAENDGIYGRWLLNTFIYAVVGGVLSTTLSAMAGYAIEKFLFPGRNFLYNLILAGVLVPGAMLALPLFLLFSSMGLTNTIWSVLIPSLVNPFGVYMARIFANASVPNELLESGRLDGASELRIFFTVAARLMSPGLITVFLFSFISIWNNFMLPLLMLQDEQNFPVMLGLYSWSTSTGRVPHLQVIVVIGAVVAVAPVIIMFLTMQRYWRSGLGAGAVKA